MYIQLLVFHPIPTVFKRTIQNTSRNSFTCCPSASIAADGEHQHMAQESHSVTDVIDIVLTRIKRVQNVSLIIHISKQVNLAIPYSTYMCISLVPRPFSKEERRSGKYSTASHIGLAVAMDSAKSYTFEIACWASANWKVH